MIYLPGKQAKDLQQYKKKGIQYLVKSVLMNKANQTKKPLRTKNGRLCLIILKKPFSKNMQKLKDKGSIRLDVSLNSKIIIINKASLNSRELFCSK
jgi:hypothetical protein